MIQPGMYQEIINRTFTESECLLPSKEEIKKAFPMEYKFDRALSDIESITGQYKYRKKSLIVLSDEFLTSLKRLIKKMKVRNVVELSCGTGWFYYWMKKYNIPIKEAIDNYSWSKTFDYLPIVKKYDSPIYVKEHPEIEMFILSWPYMDDVALNIWKNMRSGQYLFFIGEPFGGCNANDEFFRQVDKHIQPLDRKLTSNFQSFFGLHDRLALYKK